MGFTNVFIADIKNKILDFAQEEKELDDKSNDHGQDHSTNNLKANNSNEFNIDFDKVASEYHLKVNNNESELNFKQRISV